MKSKPAKKQGEKIRVEKNAPPPTTHKSAISRLRPPPPGPAMAISPPPLSPPIQQGFFHSLANNKWIANPVRLFFILAAFWLAMMLVVSVFSPSPTWGYEYDEAPLHKAPLQILEGEEYTYYLGTLSNSTFVHIAASKSSICPGGLLLYDKSFAYTPNIKYASVCVDSEGMQLSPQGARMGSNVAYEGVAWPFFAPWMLAVDDGWRWSANSTFIVGPYRTLSKTYLRFAENGSKDYLGRQGWQVEIHASEYPQGNYTKIGRVLVDKQKRIALFSDYVGVQAWLAIAPFPLAGNGTNSPG